MQISRRLFKAVLICLFFLSFGHKCFADTIVYSNLGTGNDVYNASSAWAVYGPTSPEAIGTGEGAAPAFSFTPTSTVNFTELTMALAYAGGNGNSATVELMTNASGPGTVLESWTASPLSPEAQCCTLTALSGNGSIQLEAGTTYWVGVLPDASDNFVLWNFNSTGAFTDTEYENYGNGWVPNKVVETYETGAFEVLGTGSTEPPPPTVPEPGTMTLLGTGLLGLAGMLRQRFRRTVI